MDAAIGPATLEEIADFYAAAAEYTVLRIDGIAVAMGAMSHREDRTWVMLHIAPGAEIHTIRIIRALRAHLRKKNETVYAVCGQSSKFPKAGRLLSLVGFAPTDEMAADKRIWRWCKRLPRFQEVYHAMSEKETV